MSRVKIRQSQIVSTYGPGALVDLPDYAVLIAGLEHWRGEARLIPEPRLLANLRRRLGIPFLELRSPPVPEKEEEQGTGIVAWQFPEWFVAQFEQVTSKYGRSRPVVHRLRLVKGRYSADDPTGKKKSKGWPVVPIRFVQACPNGHLSDINWSHLVHGQGVGCGGQLWLDERGTTGDLAELSVRCDGCHRTMPLIQLQGEHTRLGKCQGKRPWLGPEPGGDEVCVGPEGKAHNNRLLIRHASHAYLPVVERAISIPDHNEQLRKAIDAIWDDFLSVAESAEEVRRERRKPRVQAALEGLSDEQVWAECERRRSGGAEIQRDLKSVELDTFLSLPEELQSDRPEGDFFARRRPLDPDRRGAIEEVERVVLVHRLREVVCETGFTRFEPTVPLVDVEIDLGARLAALARETRWLPAVENRGEGVFLALRADRVKKWTTREGVKKRAADFHRGLEVTAKTTLSNERVEQIYMPYLLLHSLSHLLLTAIALECGYAAASIRERIYVRDGAYGLLLYTGTPDAEGTLGGLVEVGRKIARHLEAALELGRLCSNDPVCAQHRPNQTHEGRTLHGAACHGCLLIAEPSCERRNELLDRSLVVPTVDSTEVAFFQ